MLGRHIASRPRLAAAAALAVALLPDCTCADVQFSRAYNRHLEAEVETYAHDGTRQEIATDVVSLLTERGYAMDAWDGASETITEWHAIGEESRDRYRMSMTPGADGFTVILDVQSQNLAPPKWERKSRERSDDLAAGTLERIHPGRAAELSAEEVAGYAYDVSPKILWDAVSSEALSHGYVFGGFDPPVDVMTSSMWNEQRGEENSRARYDIKLAKAGSGKLSVEAYLTVEVGVGERAWETTGERRDFDAELDLIRRRDASEAARIEAEARAAGQEAYDKTVARREAWCGVY